jgi:hypothetical protein
LPLKASKSFFAVRDVNSRCDEAIRREISSNTEARKFRSSC